MSIPWVEFTGAALGAVFGPLVPSVISRITRRGASLNVRRDALETEICATIDFVEQLTLRFWSMDAVKLGEEGSAIAAQLVSRLHHINGLIHDLFAEDPSLLSECRSEFASASDLITGRNFDDPDRTADTRMLTASCAQILVLRRGVKSRRPKLKERLLS
jgi:hypothetical protein